MVQPHHLKNAPITEALIDFRVKARVDFNVVEFSDLKSHLKEVFPKVEERHKAEVTFRVSPTKAKTGPLLTQDLGLQGYFFKSDDEKLIAQFRVDGFTLNKLKPYSSWDELLPFAMDLWKQYYSIARPDIVTRLALRYINHITIDRNKIDFDEYLSSAPQIPLELPQFKSDFFTRVTIFDPKKSISAHITQAFEPQPSSRGKTIIFDVDAFREIDLAPSDSRIVEFFSELHDFKNMIFFNYLTEKAIGLFE